VVHRHRGSSADRRGGGIALVHRETLKVSVIDVGGNTKFELLAVKLVGRRAKSVVAACVYRSPGTVTSAFTEQLPYLFHQLVLFNSQFVVLGDFNAPGITAGHLDQRVTDVFTQHGLQQHVSTPTRGNLTSGNILELMLSLNDQPSGQLVSDVTVQSVTFSDHPVISSRAVWASRQHRQSRPCTATGRCTRLMLQRSAVIFSLRDCMTPRSQTQTTKPNCLTWKSAAFSTSTHHCAPVVVAVDSMTFASCPMKHAKTSISAVGWNVDTSELVSSLIDERMCRHAELRATV